MATKVPEGAWIAVLAMVVLFVTMKAIRRHYDNVARELAINPTERPLLPSRNHAIVLVSKLHLPSMRAIAYAKATRPSSVEAVTINVDDAEVERLREQWDQHGIDIPLVVLDSPYREVTRPLLDYIRGLRRRSPRDVVTGLHPRIRRRALVGTAPAQPERAAAQGPAAVRARRHGHQRALAAAVQPEPQSRGGRDATSFILFSGSNGERPPRRITEVACSAVGLTAIAIAATAVAATAGCATPQAPGVAASQPASSLAPTQQSARASVDQQVEQRLWSVADSAARSDGGTVKAAQAVRSTRAAAVMLTSQGVIDDNQPVWLVQVEGVADFVCNACSVPAGAAAPRGRFLTMIIGVTTFESLDFGLDSTKADLGSLGAVLDLQSGSASATAVGSSTSPAVRRSGVACAADQLTVTLGERQQVMSQPAVVIVFTNTSATGCTLYGYPDVAGLDSDGRRTGRALQVTQVYEGGAADGPSNVALDAGGGHRR